MNPNWIKVGVVTAWVYIASLVAACIVALGEGQLVAAALPFLFVHTILGPLKARVGTGIRLGLTFAFHEGLMVIAGLWTGMSSYTALAVTAGLVRALGVWIGWRSDLAGFEKTV